MNQGHFHLTVPVGATDHVLGPDHAPVTLVEYGDFECPNCKQAAPAVKLLLERFDQKVRFAYRHLPLVDVHPHAMGAAQAAECAGAQGKFWEYHDALFHDKQLEPANLKQTARTLKLDGARFDKCLDSGEQADAVKKDYNEAVRLGLSGTPSFFINRHFLSGALDYASLRDAVEQQLQGSVPSTQKAATSNPPSKDSSLK